LYLPLLFKFCIFKTLKYAPIYLSALPNSILSILNSCSDHALLCICKCLLCMQGFQYSNAKIEHTTASNQVRTRKNIQTAQWSVGQTKSRTIIIIGTRIKMLYILPLDCALWYLESKSFEKKWLSCICKPPTINLLNKTLK
jgi:hypothetical protein